MPPKKKPAQKRTAVKRGGAPKAPEARVKYYLKAAARNCMSASKAATDSSTKNMLEKEAIALNNLAQKVH